MARPRIVGAINAVPIQLTRANALHPYVPDIAGAVTDGIEVDGPGGHSIFSMVEQLQSHPAGMATEEGKIYPAACFVGAKGQRGPGAHVSLGRDLRNIVVQFAGRLFHRRGHGSRTGKASNLQ